jgi:uncharacterized membrane protein YjjP (DUF1212 family)
MSKPETPVADPRAIGSILLEIGVTLLRSGANSKRVKTNVSRIASAYNFVPHVHVGPTSVSLTLGRQGEQVVFSGTRSTPHRGVDFKCISGISRLSWAVVERPWSFEELRKEVDRLTHLPPYPRWLVLVLVGLAGGAFCLTFGGDILEIGIAFGATVLGLFLRQELVRRRFNPYLCTFTSALGASLFTGLFLKAGINIRVEHAFATCVLFLIPGVPLINAFTDLIDGNILSGVDRGVNAFIHSLAIAFGLSAGMLLASVHV